MDRNIAETVITIELDKPYKLYFDANGMVAFEEATGKNFLAVVASLYNAYRPLLESQRNGVEPNATIAGLDVIKQVPMSELTALVWAGIHVYNDRDEPSWPLTLAQVRRLINMQTIPKLFLSFLQGQSSNSPSEREMGESPARSEAAPATPQTPRQTVNGGERSIGLPEGAFT